MASNPTIVMIPGAWHSAAGFSQVRHLLQARDHPTVSEQMPALDCVTARDHNLSGDATYIREKLLLPLINEGKDIIVVMHSYGGLCGGQAVAALAGQSSRERGRRAASLD
jgi:pimeloyl-ACP methyl ester carboxylesterase